MSWKIQDKNPVPRPRLFCPECERCMYTKEDLESRERLGVCATCVPGKGPSEGRSDVVRIVLGEPD